MRFLYTPIILALFLASPLVAQEKQVAYDKKGIFIDLNFGFGQPLGLLKERFGSHQIIGLGVSYQSPQKLEFGVRFQYLFGTKVKEDVLKPYRTDFNQLIGEDGFLSNVLLKERGFFAHTFVGGIIPTGHQLKYRQGIKWSTGIGFMEHRIRIQDDSRAATQFYSVVGRGHDRLTNGLCLVGFLGYEFKSFNGKINFYTGVESIVGFTESRRAWNYDTANSDLGVSRKDLLFQFKFGWYLPFFFDQSSESIEY